MHDCETCTSDGVIPLPAVIHETGFSDLDLKSLYLYVQQMEQVDGKWWLSFPPRNEPRTGYYLSCYNYAIDAINVQMLSIHRHHGTMGLASNGFSRRAFFLYEIPLVIEPLVSSRYSSNHTLISP